MKLFAATLLCDRKRHDMLTALPHLMNHPLINQVYINIESHFQNPMFVYFDMLHYLEDCEKPWHYDIWQVQQTSWRQRPQYDQHQVRLLPIVMGRNMAIDFALSRGATHLLFVDSDVVIHPDGLQKLIDLDLPLCGGYVPGRGAHSGVHYVFGARRGILEEGDLITCDHGTCGYMLIKREVFGRLRFRWGTDPEQPTQMLSEDPAYCIDWYHISGQRFVIHKQATADHLDTGKPLTNNEVAQDNWETMGDTETSH